KTHAHRNYIDDIPRDVKIRRLNEIINSFHENAKIRYSQFIGKPQLVLIEGYSKRDSQRLKGISDGGHKIHFDDANVIDCIGVNNNNIDLMMKHLENSSKRNRFNNLFDISQKTTNMKSGDYVLVLPISTTGCSFDAIPLAKMSIAQFNNGKFSEYNINVGDNLHVFIDKYKNVNKI
ncbi:4379_t:CDS:1, partial [Dentiscutata erythropus]